MIMCAGEARRIYFKTFHTLIIFFVSLGLFILMDKELMPKVDQGQFTIKIDMPAGTKLDITN